MVNIHSIHRTSQELLGKNVSPSDIDKSAVCRQRGVYSRSCSAACGVHMGPLPADLNEKGAEPWLSGLKQESRVLLPALRCFNSWMTLRRRRMLGRRCIEAFMNSSLHGFTRVKQACSSFQGCILSSLRTLEILPVDKKFLMGLGRVAP